MAKTDKNPSTVDAIVKKAVSGAETSILSSNIIPRASFNGTPSS